jgi:hypothetical protein
MHLYRNLAGWWLLPLYKVSVNLCTIWGGVSLDFPFPLLPCTIIPASSPPRKYRKDFRSGVGGHPNQVQLPSVCKAFGTTKSTYMIESAHLADCAGSRFCCAPLRLPGFFSRFPDFSLIPCLLCQGTGKIRLILTPCLAVSSQTQAPVAVQGTGINQTLPLS